MNKNAIYSGLIALFVSTTTYGIFNFLESNEQTIKIEHVDSSPSRLTTYTDGDPHSFPLDFRQTAEDVLDAVVHIKSRHLYSGNVSTYDWRSIPHPFRDFFGDDFNKHFYSPKAPDQKNRAGKPYKVGTGSGVIVSEDGYIITNNHVIADADDIEVTLHDNSSYKARVVGTDPSTDLALLQVKGADLPQISFSDSDHVGIGEWVMAVGNPMGLNSTVTAGIVSAKGRNINILKEKYAVENFIQTDAAINPGNSGGALVNLDGGLIGINTAIASPTGTFAGYGFAIPSNIVSKIMEDLIQYGTVQRGVLGIMIKTLDNDLAKEKGLDLTAGVYVDSLMAQSAAGDAGLEKGDVIIEANGQKVRTSSELQGEVAQFRPGDKILIKYDRNGRVNEAEVTLNNRDGNTRVLSEEEALLMKKMGIDVKDLSKDELKKMKLSYGVQVEKIFPGKIRKHTQMRDDFIITHVDGEKVKNKDQLMEILSKKKGGVMLEGVYEDIPGEYFYAIGL